jgi:ABC-type glutathione transport system ATPase component
MRDLGIEVREGEVLRLIGAGKTTFLKILYRPTWQGLKTWIALPLRNLKSPKSANCSSNEKRADMNPSHQSSLLRV